MVPGAEVGYALPKVDDWEVEGGGAHVRWHGAREGGGARRGSEAHAGEDEERRDHERVRVSQAVHGSGDVAERAGVDKAGDLRHDWNERAVEADRQEVEGGEEGAARAGRGRGEDGRGVGGDDG